MGGKYSIRAEHQRRSAEQILEELRTTIVPESMDALDRIKTDIEWSDSKNNNSQIYINFHTRNLEIANSVRRYINELLWENNSKDLLELDTATSEQLLQIPDKLSLLCNKDQVTTIENYGNSGIWIGRINPFPGETLEDLISVWRTYFNRVNTLRNVLAHKIQIPIYYAFPNPQAISKSLIEFLPSDVRPRLQATIIEQPKII